MTQESKPTTTASPQGFSTLWKGIIGVLLVVTVAGIIVKQSKGPAKPADDKSAVAGFVVAVRTNLAKELVVTAEFKPYLEVQIHAKVAGYLRKLNVDIGDTVTAGQVLAVLEIPELEEDLKRAQAIEKRSQSEVERSHAAYAEVHQASSRLKEVNRAQPNLIAQQDIDTAETRDRTAAAALASAKEQVAVSQAELNRLKETLKYSVITAPFAGVITHRFADPGALIQAGTASSTQTLPLVRLSQIDRLRVVFPVSTTYAGKVHSGDSVTIQFGSTHREIVGVVARTSSSVDSVARTMSVEVDLANPDLSILPGTYATVAIPIEKRSQTVSVPVQSVSRRETATALVLNLADVIEERKLKLGLETPLSLEILDGIKEGERVILSSGSQFRAGQHVLPKLVETAHAL